MLACLLACGQLAMSNHASHTLCWASPIEVLLLSRQAPTLPLERRPVQRVKDSVHAGVQDCMVQILLLKLPPRQEHARMLGVLLVPPARPALTLPAPDFFSEAAHASDGLQLWPKAGCRGLALPPLGRLDCLPFELDLAGTAVWN